MFTEGKNTTRSITEKTPSNQNIWIPVSATDADNDALTYTLGGIDALGFSIDSSTGQLKTKIPLDYETKNQYTVTVNVSDGSLTDTITVTIDVTEIDRDIKRAPVFSEGKNTTRSIAENTPSRGKTSGFLCRLRTQMVIPSRIVSVARMLRRFLLTAAPDNCKPSHHSITKQRTDIP